METTTNADRDPYRAKLEEELGPAVLEACFSLWQEYWDSSAELPNPAAVYHDELLSWYAELHYKTRGGSHCALCHAHVRHALPLRAEREDGSIRDYACLCTRCIVGEEAVSSRLQYRIGERWIDHRPLTNKTPQEPIARRARILRFPRQAV